MSGTGRVLKFWSGMIRRMDVRGTRSPIFVVTRFDSKMMGHAGET